MTETREVNLPSTASLNAASPNDRSMPWSWDSCRGQQPQAPFILQRNTGWSRGTSIWTPPSEKPCFSFLDTALLQGRLFPHLWKVKQGQSATHWHLPGQGNIRGSKRLACPEISLQIGPLRHLSHFCGLRDIPTDLPSKAQVCFLGACHLLGNSPSVTLETMHH